MLAAMPATPSMAFQPTVNHASHCPLRTSAGRPWVPGCPTAAGWTVQVERSVRSATTVEIGV